MNIKTTTKDFLKTRLVGAGNDVVLKAPNNTSQLLMSVESFSVIDLLAEGPIGGVVDQKGAYVGGDRLLCGVYIDQVPVRETLSQESYIYNSFPTGVNSTQPFSRDLTGIANILDSYDSAFQSIYRDEDEEMLDLDKAFAAGAYQLNKGLQSLLQYTSEEEAMLLRGQSAFFVSEDIKYAFIPSSAVDISNLNITENNTSIQVMYSGANGEIGILNNRYRKNSNNEGAFNQMVVSKIPDPIINFSYKFNAQSTNVSVSDIRDGYILIPIASGDTLASVGGKVKFTSVDSECLDFTSQELSGASIFLQSFREDASNTYNYDKIDVEVRNGEENQLPLDNVIETSRSYDTNFTLVGAVTPESYHDKIDPLKGENVKPSTADSAYTSQSRLVEGGEDYAQWAKDSFNNYRDEKAAYSHIIENPAVTKVSATFTLGSLYDTQVTEKPEDKAGTQTVATVEMGIEIGLEGDNDPSDPLYETLKQYHKDITFGIEGLVRGTPFRFRVGGGNNSARGSWIAGTRGTKFSDLNDLPLPAEVQGRKRYIKIYRKTPETFSSKRSISITLSAINEYYGKSFSYPLSAHAGVMIDSRGFSRVPSRAYDLRLKKVLIPSNYYPLYNNGIDKRFISNKNDWDSNNKPKIYNGDWDGTFRYDWTDNPAWILYDMLIDPVYAIGNQFDDLRDINIWQLYEIGKFCDAINDDGEFIGVNDGYGGLEPRFSCNVMLNNEQEAYDILNSIATVFRGTVFYAGSDVDFYYDVEDEPVATFNNHNVDNGSFTYSDSLKSSRYTVVEVPYMDRKDNFLQKVEYYEDEESIQRYGYIKHVFQGIGITSRGQAQRFAKYALLSNKLETETVQFAAGREAMLLQPSDIIRVDDELKKLQAVGNYIAEIDYDNKQIILPHMPTGGLDTEIYLYCLTGENTLDQLFQDAYDEELSISQGKIDNLNTRKIKQFSVSSYSYTGTDGGGTGLVVNIDPSQSGIAKFNDVLVGSLCSIKTTGRNDSLYKVISMSEEGEGKINILASQYEPQKFGLVESGIKFSQEEDYFANLSVDYNDNTPDPPQSVTVSGGVNVVDGKGGIYLTGTIIENATYPLTEKYHCYLTTPRGTKLTKSIYNSSASEQVVFGPMYEFGTYNLSVYGESAEPLKLRSVGATSSTTSISLSSSAYDYCVINSVSFQKGAGEYSAPEGESEKNSEGTFELYQGDLNIVWTVRDRIGRVITTAEGMRTNWDYPKVSLDIKYDDGTYAAKDWIYRSESVGALIRQEQLNTWFNGSIPRSFDIVLRMTSDSQPEESIATINILNPEPKLDIVRVSSSYDSIANGFNIFADAPKRYRDDIERLYLYTGNSQTGVGELFTEIDIGNKSALAKKDSLLLYGDLYDNITDNTLLSVESLYDSLFFNGEPVEMNSFASPSDFPDGMSGDTAYQIVLGNTFNSLLYLDANRGYYNTGLAINNQSYLTNAGLRQLNDGYYPFERLTGVTSNTAGGTGLISGSDVSYRYPIVNESAEGVWIYNAAYSSYANSGWVNTSELPGGYVTGNINNDVGGNRSWSDNWVYFGSLSSWVFVADTEYSFGANASVGKFETSKYFDIRNRNGFRLAEEEPAGVSNATFQSGTESFSAVAWAAPMKTLNKMYLFDCGGQSGGWSFYLSGQETAGNPSGSYRLDVRLSDQPAVGSTGGLITVTGGLNAWEIGKWSHFGINFYTITGAGGNTGYADVYLNGKLDNSGVASGSGTNPHNGACGIGTQMGQSVSGAGNNGGVSDWTDNYFFGHITDVGIFAASMLGQEMQEQYYGIRNQYSFKLSTGGNLIQEITGENPSNLISVNSLDNSIIQVSVQNAAGAGASEKSLIEKINTLGMTGIYKQFTLRSEVDSDNEKFQNLINGTFYLDEADYLGNVYDWHKIGEEDIGIRYLTTGQLGSPTPKWGKWILYSGETGTILYQYTGIDADNAGGIHESGGASASGKVPIAVRMKTGASGNTLGFPVSPLPQIMNTNISDNTSVRFADFYLRVKAEDYLGQSESFYPRVGLPAVQVNFAELSDVGAKTKAQAGLAAGEQLQNLIETLRRAGETGVDYYGFQAALSNGGFKALVSESPIIKDTAPDAYKTSKPNIETSFPIVLDDIEFRSDGYTFDLTVTAYHESSDADIFFSTLKSDVIAASPSPSLKGTPSVTDARFKTKTLTVMDRSSIWVTAKTPGKAISEYDSERVSIEFHNAADL